MAGFPVLLGAVVIDATNKGIRFEEAAVLETVNLVEGTYFLRGDGSADDLCLAIKTALESNSNATNPNTYNVTLTLSTSPAAPTAVVNISRATGSSTFKLAFASGSETFDVGLIGFPPDNTGSNASDKPSTLSPSSIWVGNDMYRSLEPQPAWIRRRTRARSGKVRAVQRMSTRDRLWVQEYIEARRMLEEEISADPHRALSRFLERHAGGLRFEFHDGTISSGTTLAALSSSTEQGSCFIFDDDFYPERGSFAARLDGGPLYSFQGMLLPYVS